MWPGSGTTSTTAMRNCNCNGATHVRVLLAVILLLLFSPAAGAAAPLYSVTKVEERLYAAIADPRGEAASNALIIITPTSVLVAGAHFTPAGAAEITRIIAGITPLQLRTVILTHHHQESPAEDFGFPPTVELITSARSWSNLKGEKPQLNNKVISFEKVMTINGGKQTILLTVMEPGHATGNLVVYLPEQAVLFASDLMYNNVAGIMNDGHPRGWVQDLLQLENLVVTKVVPGRGNVTDGAGLQRFRFFLQDFFTEIVGHLERGESAEETVQRFHLPPEKIPPFFSLVQRKSIEWAWRELREQR